MVLGACDVMSGAGTAALEAGSTVLIQRAGEAMLPGANRDLLLQARLMMGLRASSPRPHECCPLL